MGSSTLRRFACAALLAAGAALGIASCGSDGRALSVDLRTDLVPGTEFGSVVTKIEGGSASQHGASESSSQYVAGTRVADFADLPDGNVTVQVTLVDPEGTPLVSRTSSVRLQQDYALTVVVTRSCAGVVCPEPAGDQALTTCQAGRCTSPACTPETPESCPEPECTTDGDCRSEIACLAPRCDHGVCLFPPNDALCKQGETCDANQGCVDANGNPVCTPTSATEKSCGDKIDDDCDGRVDCLDDDCNLVACEDGDKCTQGEVCKDGTCAGAQPISCDDDDACTDDDCDPTSGCTHTNNTASCDDGDACTSGDVCADGVCTPGGATACDDGNPCTDDTCDGANGCAHTNNTASCDDGDACTSGDVCESGACKPGALLSCDDGNACTDDTCDKQSGCAHADNAGSCSDDVFCNGPDTCQTGACAVHAGSPCAQLCDEANDTCVGCFANGDCGAVSYGAWSACGGFADACDTSGTQSRTVFTPACNSGTCTTTQTIETQACVRTTDGSVCGSVTYGTWSACGGFGSTCDTSGTQSRSVTTPTCQAGVCSNVVTNDSQSCTRTTNGTTCSATTYGTWSACGGFSSACDTTGTKSRSVTTHTCGSGSCGSSTTTENQSCTRSVSNGTSCGGSNYCCGGSCVSKGSNSHCGSCGIVCTNGHTCGSPGGGHYDCHCSTNAECGTAGYGSGATCYTDGTGSFCNCQCPGGASSCSGLCKGGATCHDVSGQNYCAYP
jgi:hypothetical protein